MLRLLGQVARARRPGASPEQPGWGSIMNDGGVQDTVNSLRRIATTGAVLAVVLLVGAVVLMASSALFSVARFSPFGVWGVLGVLGVAVVAALLVWRFGTHGRPFGGGRHQRTLATDIIYRAPPPAPIRAPRAPAQIAATGRLGAESAVNALIEERRYSEALSRLDQLERDDPAMLSFVTAKRRAVARRQRRDR